MSQKKEWSDLTDQELLVEAKRVKWSAITRAFVIGFMIGVMLYSVAKNTWGLVTLIPLFFIYKLTSSPNDYKKLKELLRERNLS